MSPDNQIVTEAQITELVKSFYERAAANADLHAIFAAVIDDWDAHHRIVANFWSHVLLGTDRYRSSPYMQHTRLPLKLEHFDIWLELFRQTAREVLPSTAADTAIARAELMAESFRVGMFNDYPGKAAMASLARPAE
jgi:hemoglobin